MRAIIISIGDEILNGTTINTNASFISSKIEPLGIEIYEVIAIADEEEHILSTLARYSGIFEFIFITGGLGPTKDDITKKTLCKFYNSKLIHHENILQRLKIAFEKRNIPFTENNYDQALYPDNCIILRNDLGTAQGMWFTDRKSAVISMPGVPFEMKGIINDIIIPKIKNEFQFPLIINKYIMTSGVSESLVAKKIESIEKELPENISLAFLPSPGVVKLRLTATGSDAEVLNIKLNQFTQQIKNELGIFVYAEAPIQLEEFIGKQLLELKATVSTAESCTGGKIAHKITAIAGSSLYFAGSIICYSEKIKISHLDVSPLTIKKYGVVSEETVLEMLAGALKNLKTDFAVAVSGNAGPQAGASDKPVGTIIIGVASREEQRVKKYFFNKNREINIEYAAMFALHELRMLLTDCLVKA